MNSSSESIQGQTTEIRDATMGAIGPYICVHIMDCKDLYEHVERHTKSMITPVPLVLASTLQEASDYSMAP